MVWKGGNYQAGAVELWSIREPQLHSSRMDSLPDKGIDPHSVQSIFSAQNARYVQATSP